MAKSQEVLCESASDEELTLGHKRNQRGAAMVEYALMVALISLGLIGSVSALAERERGIFREAEEKNGDCR